MPRNGLGEPSLSPGIEPMSEVVETKRHGSVCLAVVDAVAETTGTARNELPPLAEAIDPDAVEVLFESVTGPSATDGRLTFRYAGCTVAVESDGSVSVTPKADDAADLHSMTAEG